MSESSQLLAFYEALLDLELPGSRDEVTEVLRRALGLATDITQAERGFIELVDQDRRPCWSHGFDDAEVEAVRAQVSSGVIAETLAQGQPLRLAHALSDPRFETRASVQQNQITTVLCVPVGLGLGVIYLEGHRRNRRFTPDDQARIVHMGRHLGLLFDRLLHARPSAAASLGQLARGDLVLDGLVAESPAMLEVMVQLRRIQGPIDEPVVLTGPTGVGKTTLARLVHLNSGRAKGPFEVFSCAELNQELVESELFGAIKGAHSTAHETRKGVLAEAEGGTLFLDELQELGLPAQAALLRLLESGEYRPVGASKSRRADVRIVAAMNQAPQACMDAGTLRQDFWYRIAAFVIDVPPLKDRREDIAPLARQFCDELAGELNMEPRRLTPELIAELQGRDWPGNVRDLRRALKTALFNSRFPASTELGLEHLRYGGPAGSALNLAVATQRFQRAHVIEVLRIATSMRHAAELLGVSRSTLYELLKRLDIDPSDVGGD